MNPVAQAFAYLVLWPLVFAPLAAWRWLFPRLHISWLVTLALLGPALVLVAKILPGRALDPILALGPLGLALLFMLVCVEYVLLAGVVFLPLLLIQQHFGKPGGPAIAGQQLRPVSTKPKKWLTYRAEAKQNREWFVGVSHTNHKPVMLTTRARVMHTWVVGASGTGKTESGLLPAIASDIEAHRPVFIIDGKAQRSTLDTIYGLCCEAGAKDAFGVFDLGNPELSMSYSPLRQGTANEQLDKIASACTWESEYYKTESLAALSTVLRSLVATGQEYSLADLESAISDELAAAWLRRHLRDKAPNLADELDELLKNWKAHLERTAGFRGQLRELLRSDCGELLSHARPVLDLEAFHQGAGVIYFGLPVARFPRTSQLLARLILMDIGCLAGRIQAGQVEATRTAAVYVDEFASFAIPEAIDLLNKARSARIAITIATQSAKGDFASARAGFAEQVAANTNIKIAFAQYDAEDAEYVASLAGTYTTTKRTEQVEAGLIGPVRTGMASEREVEEFVVHPNTIRNLAQGQAVVLVKQPPEARRVDLVAFDQITTEGWPRYPGLNAEPQKPCGLDLRARAREMEAETHDAERALAPKTRAERAELKKRLLVEMEADDDPEEKPD
jgi:hypothetical protein